MRKALFLAVALAGAVLVPGTTAAAATCGTSASGGEWPSYGQSLANARNQASETTITKDNVANLQPAWSFSAAGMGGRSGFSSTPVIAEGCIFMATDGNIGGGSQVSVFAADAVTGEPKWRTDLPGGPAWLGGAFSPAVADGRVYVIVGQTVPVAVALDAATGEELWRYEMPDPVHGTGIQASAVTYDGMVFVATVGYDAILPFSRPYFYILDGASGQLIKRTQVIPDSDYLDGSFRSGGGMWSTAAIDTETKQLFVGTTNPYNRAKEHERTNSVMKIDFDRSSPTFGEVVGNYKGDPDYDPALYNTFQCQTLGEAQLVLFGVLCGQKDVDFGASPNIFKTSGGQTLVGALQKSGVYHAIDPDTMQAAWRANLAPPNLNSNSATAATDEDTIYVATDQSRIYALDQDTGTAKWAVTIDGVGGYFPPSLANGVLYTMASAGNVIALDTETGEVLFNSQLEDQAGTCGGTSATGVAIAHNTIYTVCTSGADGSGSVVAYTL